MRGRAGVLAFGLVLTAGCASSGGTSPTGAPSSGPSATSSVPVTEPAAVRDDLAAVFERAGVRGTFVLLEVDGASVP